MIIYKSMEDKDFHYGFNTNQYNSNKLPSNKNLSTDNTTFNSYPSSVVECMNPSQSKNNTGVESSQKPKHEEGIMRRMLKYIKNINWPWKIEEEEYIDAHGFIAKRPKKKIPLRKKGDQYRDEINKAGGDGFSYASRNVGFGKIFL